MRLYPRGRRRISKMIADRKSVQMKNALKMKNHYLADEMMFKPPRIVRGKQKERDRTRATVKSEKDCGGKDEHLSSAMNWGATITTRKSDSGQADRKKTRFNKRKGKSNDNTFKINQVHYRINPGTCNQLHRVFAEVDKIKNRAG